MSTRIHIYVANDLLARVDAARGDVPRSAWLRRAVERALGPTSGERPPTLEEFLDKNEVEYRASRPAEQPEVPGGRRPSDYGMDEAARAEFVRPIREQLPSARPFQGSYDPFKKR